MPYLEWKKVKVFIIGKTYPVISRKYNELVCTGGITENSDLIRLYPLPYRYLHDDQQFPIYSWIEVEICKAYDDVRKESYKIKPESIRILERLKGWDKRWQIIEPTLTSSLEYLEKQRKKDNTSLGIIRITYKNFSWEFQGREWPIDKKSILDQMDFLKDVKPLEFIPYKFYLSYRCSDNPNCRGHKQSILSWEYSQAFRSFIKQYNSEENALSIMKNTLEGERYFDLQGSSRERIALLGTIKQYHQFGKWIIGGLFFPPKIRQITLV